MRIAALSRGQSGWGVKFYTHLYLVSRLRMNGAIRLLLQTAVMSCIKTKFYSCHSTIQQHFRPDSWHAALTLLPLHSHHTVITLGSPHLSVFIKRALGSLPLLNILCKCTCRQAHTSTQYTLPDPLLTLQLLELLIQDSSLLRR